MNAYIIAGQSNALGISPVKDLPDSIPFGDILIYSSSNVLSGKSNRILPMGYGFGADESKFGTDVVSFIVMI